MCGCFIVLLAAARTPFIATVFAQTTDEGWHLAFTVSGGFAGLNRQLDVESGGAATAFDHRRKVQVRRQIAPDVLSEIERFVASATSFEAGNDTCGDCLTYAIDLRVHGRTVSIRTNDITLSDSKAAALVQALARMQQRLLSEP